MENNHFTEVLKVTWESLFAGTGNPSLLSIEDVCLISVGIVCMIAARRHMSRLASARRLQPATAQRLRQDLQRELQRDSQRDLQEPLSPAAPLSAPLHVASPHVSSPVATSVPSSTGVASHAA